MDGFLYMILHGSTRLFLYRTLSSCDRKRSCILQVSFIGASHHRCPPGGDVLPRRHLMSLIFLSILPRPCIIYNELVITAKSYLRIVTEVRFKVMWQQDLQCHIQCLMFCKSTSISWCVIMIYRRISTDILLTLWRTHLISIYFNPWKIYPGERNTISFLHPVGPHLQVDPAWLPELCPRFFCTSLMPSSVLTLLAFVWWNLNFLIALSNRWKQNISG